MPPKELLIVDPLLIDTVGHQFEYTKSIAVAARSRGLNVKIAVNRRVTPSVQQALQATPMFSHSLYNTAIKMANSPSVIKQLNGLLWIVQFFFEWRRSIFVKDIRAETLIFLPNCTDVNVFSLIVWLRMRRPVRRPRLICLFRFNPRFTMRFVGWMMRSLVHQGTVALVTDSTLLANEYSRRTGLRYDVFPIPHLPEALSCHTVSPRDSSRSLQVVFLGMARLEKGIDILSQAIPYLDQDVRANKLKFVIQCGGLGHEPEIFGVVKQLEALQVQYGPAITLIQRSLETKEYYNLLIESDIVLIPYRKQAFYAKTSGIFTEALAAAKPVVVTNGTWMSAQLEHYNSGVTFEDGDPVNLANSIRYICTNFEQEKAKAIENRTRWNVSHGPEIVLDKILSYWDK